MSTRDKIKVVRLALSMLGVPIFIHLSYIKLYDDYVNSYLILLVVLVLILDINDIVKELLGQSNQMTTNILQLLSNQMTLNILPLCVLSGYTLVEQLPTNYNLFNSYCYGNKSYKRCC